MLCQTAVDAAVNHAINPSMGCFIFRVLFPVAYEPPVATYGAKGGLEAGGQNVPQVTRLRGLRRNRVAA